MNCLILLLAHQLVILIKLSAVDTPICSCTSIIQINLNIFRKYYENLHETMSSIISIEKDSLPSSGDRSLSFTSTTNEPQLKRLQPGQGFPIQTSAYVYGQDLPGASDVNIVINQFADNILIIVTDISKPGSIFYIKRDQSKSVQSAGSSKGSDYLYSVELLLGAETPELTTTARFLGQCLNKEKPILLTLGFKDPQKSLSPSKAKSLVTFIKQCF